MSPGSRRLYGNAHHLRGLQMYCSRILKYREVRHQYNLFSIVLSPNYGAPSHFRRIPSSIRVAEYYLSSSLGFKAFYDHALSVPWGSYSTTFCCTVYVSATLNVYRSCTYCPWKKFAFGSDIYFTWNMVAPTPCQSLTYLMVSLSHWV